MKLREWKLRCPYGKWTCADGREVLFKPANPDEWIRWKKQDHYFDDSNTPWSHHRDRASRTLQRCNSVLIEWEYPPLPKPPKPEAWSGPLRFLDLTKQSPPRVNPYNVNDEARLEEIERQQQAARDARDAEDRASDAEWRTEMMEEDLCE